jgi:hypothetical protein
MKLEIERSGGFAGLTKTITVDTNDLPRDMATKIEKYIVTKLIKGSSLPMKKKEVADSFFYKISGHIGKEQKQLYFNDFDIDKEIRVVLNHLFKY